MAHSLKINSLKYPEYSVSELSHHIKDTVETNFSSVCVRGEISGYRGIHSSGHAYFTLKDNKSRIDAIIWKGTFKQMEHHPEEGIEFLAFGKITTFPGSSKYQIIIDSLIPSGAGAFMTILEARKKKLQAEGLFSDKHKNAIPFMPKIIAVITSPTGAVIRDILQRISCRFPLRVIVFPVKVQGKECPAEIINAINQLKSLGEDGPCPRPDIIILARGGGSLEDIWHFNDEEVVRTVANSPIPIISAIGHETDWTLVDYAADLRAPTPTGAAEIAVPVKSSLQSSLIGLNNRLHETVSRIISNTTNQLSSLIRAFPNSDKILAYPRYHIDRLSRELEHNLEIMTFRKHRNLNNAVLKIKSDLPISYINNNRQKITKKTQYISYTIEQQLKCSRLKIQQKSVTLDILCEQKRIQTKHIAIHLEELINRAEFILSHKIKHCYTSILIPNRILKSISHSSTIKRGYSIIRDAHNGIITKAKKLPVGTNISIEFFDGQAKAMITNNDQEDDAIIKDTSKKQTSRKPKIKKSGNGNQGNLF